MPDVAPRELLVLERKLYPIEGCISHIHPPQGDHLSCRETKRIRHLSEERDPYGTLVYGGGLAKLYGRAIALAAAAASRDDCTKHKRPSECQCCGCCCRLRGRRSDLHELVAAQTKLVRHVRSNKQLLR